MLIALILMYSLQGAAEKWDWFQCLETSDGSVVYNQSSCYGISAVLRMSFVLFWFHVITLIAISPRISCSNFVHDGFWTFKILFVCVLYIGFFFIPHNVFQVWAHICRAGSTLFFII